MIHYICIPEKIEDVIIIINLNKIRIPQLPGRVRVVFEC